MVKVEPSKCSARLAELSPAVVVADLPASEPRQPRDTTGAGPEPEAPIPNDGSNTDLFHGLTDLDDTYPELTFSHISFPVSLSSACSSLFA